MSNFCATIEQLTYSSTAGSREALAPAVILRILETYNHLFRVHRSFYYARTASKTRNSPPRAAAISPLVPTETSVVREHVRWVLYFVLFMCH